ncbi:MAG: hypothetical protein DRJ56_07555, partial [Thermoprotei archaeon]
MLAVRAELPTPLAVLGEQPVGLARGYQVLLPPLSGYRVSGELEWCEGGALSLVPVEGGRLKRVRV